MKVLLLGSGGREHALAWKLAQSPGLTRLWCAPGNPGIAAHATLLEGRVDEPDDVLRMARAVGAELVVVGPEVPLVAGVSDPLVRAGIPVFGPSAAAAKIEGSKAYCKEVMASAAVPTAAYRVFDEREPAEAYARSLPRVVVKVDGLAAGKGVIVAHAPEEAAAAVRTLWDLAGPDARRLVLEEVLEGEEISMIALCDGERFVLLPSAQDHKRWGDGDTGPNTGGMGAYAPVARYEPGLHATLGPTVIAPVLAELRRRGTPFRGALFAGLMMTPTGPRVLEFNCRMGDPETQVLMMQLDEDVLPLFAACATGSLHPRPLNLHPGASVAVVLSAEGYPAKARSGDVVEGLGSGAGPAQVFQAGTAARGGAVVTAGGRVLSVCARGRDLAEARARAYEAVGRVHFAGVHFRRDIGARGLLSP